MVSDRRMVLCLVSAIITLGDVGMADRGTWVTQGFEGFIQGTFGNGGQNLYVSRAGVLQRIHHYDVDGDGYLDVLFCNSQNHWEQPPAYVYHDVLGAARRVDLRSDGALSGAVADLNGDGYDDLVLAMHENGVRQDLNAFIYYGSPEGLTERYHVEVPVPLATSVAIGDFNGDGRPDLAFLSKGSVRLFYQNDLGFEPKRFVDLEIRGDQLAAEDLDGDGASELVVLDREGKARVYWGSKDGLSPESVSEVPVEVGQLPAPAEEVVTTSEAEHIAPSPAIPKVLFFGRVPHVFVPGARCAYLVPVGAGRTFGEPLVLECPRALSAATGDINGDGYVDIAFSTRTKHEGVECSWIYWGGPEGFDPTRRTALPSYSACDIAVADLDGDGFDEVVICQDHTPESFTFHSLVYRGSAQGVQPEPVRLETLDARRVLVASTCDDPLPQLIFVNHRARRVGGDVDVAIYHGGADGFSTERCTRLAARDAVDAVCCDLDDDGFADVVIANCSENAVHLDPGSFIFKGGPNGLPYEPDVVLATTRAHGVCCGDLNHDGYLDLVLGGFNFPEILVFYGGPEGFDGQNPVRVFTDIGGNNWKDPRWLYLADLNNDGWLDLFVPQISSDRSFILWGGIDGFSMDRIHVLPVIHASCAQAADLTGNGWLDLIIAGHQPDRFGPHDSFVYIYWNGPEGIREDRRTQLPANGVNALQVADFNGDGRLDIFVCNYHEGRSRDINSYLYWGREGARFSPTDRQELFTHSASGCVAADFNEDGWIDLAVANHKVYGDHAGWSAVWWNGPDGFSEERVTILPTLGPHGMIRVPTGNQADRGPQEYYTSAPFELPQGAMVRRIAWEADLPPKTWVRAQLRFAADPRRLEQAPWQGPNGNAGWFDNGAETTGLLQHGRWVQYRLALGAVGCGRTPRVREVRVDYGP
jgi:hypothetical protein